MINMVFYPEGISIKHDLAIYLFTDKQIATLMNYKQKPGDEKRIFTFKGHYHYIIGGINLRKKKDFNIFDHAVLGKYNPLTSRLWYMKKDKNRCITELSNYGTSTNNYEFCIFLSTNEKIDHTEIFSDTNDFMINDKYNKVSVPIKSKYNKNKLNNT